MHLNSGLLLRKPGESIYAVARRFAIANPALSYASLIAEARQRLVNDKSRDRTNVSLIGRLACHTEMELCAKLGIDCPSYSMSPPAPFAENPRSFTISRQCPQCAEGVFHSPLYELPWLTRCPIHHCALTASCPGCGKGWPAISRIWSGLCFVCGIQLSPEALLHASRCTGEWDFASLQVLARLVEHKTLRDDILLMPRHPDCDDAFDSYYHVPMRLRDRLFPSVISSLNTEVKYFCSRHGIATENCIRVNFAGLSVPIKHARPSQWLPSWMIKCQQRVRAKIASAVARSAGPSHTLTQHDLWHWMWTARSEHCAYCKAHSEWCDLIKQFPSRRSSSDFEQSKPNVPQAMQLAEVKALEFSQGIQQIEDFSLFYELPIAAQRFLYSLDLWTTFVAIFQSVEYELTFPASFPYAFMIDRCEKELCVNAPISRSVAFWKTRHYELVICVPKSVIRPQINTRFADHWVKVCSSTNSHE